MMFSEVHGLLSSFVAVVCVDGRAFVARLGSVVLAETAGSKRGDLTRRTSTRVHALYLSNPIWPGRSSHLVIWFCFAPPSGPGNSWRAMCFPGGTFHRCTTVCLLAFTFVSNKRNNKYGPTRRSRTYSELHTGSWISMFESKHALVNLYDGSYNFVV